MYNVCEVLIIIRYMNIWQLWQDKRQWCSRKNHRQMRDHRERFLPLLWLWRMAYSRNCSLFSIPSDFSSWYLPSLVAPCPFNLWWIQRAAGWFNAWISTILFFYGIGYVLCVCILSDDLRHATTDIGSSNTVRKEKIVLAGLTCFCTTFQKITRIRVIQK